MPPLWKALSIITALVAAGTLVVVPYLYRENRDRAEEAEALTGKLQVVQCAAADVVKYGSPVQFPGESDAHYAKYLKAGGRFLRLVAELDCQSILRQAGQEGRDRESPSSSEGVTGGGGDSPSGQPSPPSGGGQGNAPGPQGPPGGSGPPGPPGQPPPKPDPPPTLLDPVCDLVDGLGIPLC